MWTALVIALLLVLAVLVAAGIVLCIWTLIRHVQAERRRQPL